MNKIYSVIWSHVKQCYVVASELAKAHGRTSIGGRTSRLAVAALTAFILTAGATSVGLAADPATDANIHYYSMNPTSDPALGKGSNYNNDGATGDDAIAIGPLASAKGNHSLALGYNAETTHLEGKDDHDDNMAVGYRSQAGYRSTALGYNSKATGLYDVALGTDALADNENSTAVGMNAQAEGKQATALGSLAKASGESATAVGEGANALAQYSSAVGQGASVDASASTGTALGYQAKVLAGAENSMTLGASSQVSGANSIAIGTGATVTSGQSIAIGKGATVSLSRSVALGDGSIASTAPTDVSSITIPNLNRTYTVSGNWPVGIVSVGSPTAQRTITNVAAGRVTSDSTDAVNGSELYAVATEAAKHTIVSTEDSNLSVKNIAKEGEAANYQISLNKNLNVDSVTAANKIPTKDLEVTGSATIGKVTINKDNKGTIGGLTNKTWDAKNITSGQAATEDQLQAATKNAVNYDGDESKTVTLREDTTIKNVANTTIEQASTNAVNAGTVYNETRVEKDGIFIRKDNTAGQNITALDHQLAANTESIYNINNRVSNLDNRINKVGAGAAALAALHPLDFNPDDKWDFAVGYGNYRNANSVAFGAFYRPNEDTMFSLGTNFGNGENMFNAGISFKIGKGNSYAGISKAQLVAENQQLKANDARQDREIQELKKALEELKSRIK